MTTNDIPTYEERIERYRVVRREANMSDERKAAMRLNGLDPDDTWSLIWSFACPIAAEEQKLHEEALADANGFGHLYEWRVLDHGKAETITRQAWL